MKLVPVLILLLVWGSAFGQDRKAFRPATEAEFTGYWRIMLIPDEKMNLKIKNKQTGYDDPCQIFMHKPDGVWMSVSISNAAGAEETRRYCATLRKQDVDLHLASVLGAPVRYRWRRLPGDRPAVFLIQDATGKERRFWVPDYVEDDVSLPNYFDFKKGDLIMNLAIPGEKRGEIVISWRMVLRPVLDSANP